MQLVLGDMAIKDLTPQTTNVGDRIVKNMRICGSGIYTYRMSEASLLGLTPVPEKYKNLQFINVYRPPEVLQANKDKFARVPIITGHHVQVNRANAKQLVVGMVGDTVQTEVDKSDGELYLYTTGTIVAGDGVDAYERYGQLSCGYVPTMEWCDGDHKGVPYQAKLTGFDDVNHLLICKVARGGPQCMVMDSLDGTGPLDRILSYNGGQKMSFFQHIFGKKKVVGDSAVVSTLIQSIAAGADPAVQVPKIKSLVGDSNPEFNTFLDDLANSKGADPKQLQEACNIVEKFYNEKIAGDTANGTDPATEKPAGVSDKDKDKPAGDEPPKDVPPKNDKKPATDDKCPDCGKPKGECTCGKDKKPAGDSIDYDLIAQKTAAIMLAAQAPATAGDTAPAQTTAIQGAVQMGGDSAATNPNVLTSDKVMEIFD